MSWVWDTCRSTASLSLFVAFGIFCNVNCRCFSILYYFLFQMYFLVMPSCFTMSASACFSHFDFCKTKHSVVLFSSLLLSWFGLCVCGFCDLYHMMLFLSANAAELYLCSVRSNTATA